MTKTLFKDLIKSGDLTSTNGQLIEKIEGLAVTANGDVWINTDNDGVDDNSGESLLTKVGTYGESEMESSSGATNELFDKSSMLSMTVVLCLAPFVATIASF